MGLVNSLNYLLFENSKVGRVLNLLERRGWLGKAVELTRYGGPVDNVYDLVSPRSKEPIGVVIEVRSDGGVNLIVPRGFIPAMSGRLRAIQMEKDETRYGEYRLVFNSSREFFSLFPDLDSSLSKYLPFVSRAMRVFRRVNGELEELKRREKPYVLYSSTDVYNIRYYLECRVFNDSPSISFDNVAYFPNYVVTETRPFDQMNDSTVEYRIVKDIFSKSWKLMTGVRMGGSPERIRWKSLDDFAEGLPKLVEQFVKQVKEARGL